MAKSKTQADPGRSREGQSPPSGARVERKRKAAGKSSPKSVPKVGKGQVGSGGRKALH